MLDRFKLNKFLVAVLTLIFLLAMGVRIGLIIINPGFVPFYGMITPIGDAARNLIEGRGYVVDSEYVDSIISVTEKKNILIDIQDVPPPPNEKFKPYYALPPGTSLMLAGTYLIFGQYRYIYLRYIQAIIDSFGCLLIFLVGKELLSRRVGVISAFLYAVWLPIAYLSTWPLHDALMPFITLLALYLFILGVRRKSLIFYALSGLAIGVGCYFQPSILLLPVMFGIGLFIYNFQRQDFKNHVVNVVKMTAIMLAVVMIVISPWVARNYRVTGALIGMRPGVWSGIWEGFGEFGENPVGAVLDDTATYDLAKKETGHDIEYLSPEYQRFFKTKVLKAIVEYPGWWLSLLARRIPKATFYCSELGINTALTGIFDMDYPNQTISAMIRNSALWKIIQNSSCTIFYIPVLLSIFSIWVMRRNWRPLALVLTVVAYFAAVHIIVFTASSKSLMPGSLSYIILSAITFDYFYRRIKGTSTSAVKYNHTC